MHGASAPRSSGDEIADWLQARGKVVSQAPAVAPDYFRHSKLAVAGVGEMASITGQCGPDAYVFATRTLGELTADTSLKDANRRAWIAAQDAVFARCAWTPGNAAAPGP